MHDVRFLKSITERQCSQVVGYEWSERSYQPSAFSEKSISHSEYRLNKKRDSSLRWRSAQNDRKGDGKLSAISGQREPFQLWVLARRKTRILANHSPVNIVE
jgi:hypothetical protein